MPTYYLGLDVHKVRTQYCLMDPAGEILAEGSLPTERSRRRPGGLRRRPRGDRQLAPHLRRPAQLRRRGEAGAPLAREGDRLGAREDRQDRRAHPRPPPAHRPRARGLGAARRGARAARPRAPPLALRRPAHHGQEPHHQPARAPVPALRGHRPLRQRRPRLARRARARRPQPHAHRAAARHHRRGRRPRLCAHGAAARAPRRRPRGGPAQTIPGVGFLTAATLVAELGDPRRFCRAAQVSAYFGLVPRVRASADVAHYGRITRAGSPHARRALVEAAHVAVRLPGPLRDRYLARARRRGKKVALVAAARELLELSWTLLDRGEVYRAAA